MRFAEGVSTTTRTGQFGAALSDFGSKISLHAVETHRVPVRRAAFDDSVRGVLIITGDTGRELATV